MGWRLSVQPNRGAKCSDAALCQAGDAGPGSPSDPAGRWCAAKENRKPKAAVPVHPSAGARRKESRERDPSTRSLGPKANPGAGACGICCPRPWPRPHQPSRSPRQPLPRRHVPRTHPHLPAPAATLAPAPGRGRDAPARGARAAGARANAAHLSQGIRAYRGVLRFRRTVQGISRCRLFRVSRASVMNRQSWSARKP